MRLDLIEKIQPHDIFQGILDDCYFLAALSALAERPIFIERLFDMDRSDSVVEKKYYVELILGGMKKKVELDDFVPCVEKNGRYTPLFAKTGDAEDEIWVLLLEKAWAKLYGSYEKIAWGDLEEALSACTGAPVYQNFFDGTIGKNEENWKILLNAAKENYPSLAASTHKRNDKNVVRNHAYTILDAYELYGNRYVKLRNPFGKNEPDGRIAYRGKQEDDGIFDMEYDFFTTFFNGFSFAKIVPNASYTSIKISKKNKALINVKVPERGYYYLTLHNAPKRCFKDQDFRYPRIGFKFAQFSSIEVSLISS